MNIKKYRDTWHQIIRQVEWHLSQNWSAIKILLANLACDALIHYKSISSFWNFLIKNYFCDSCIIVEEFIPIIMYIVVKKET